MDGWRDKYKKIQYFGLTIHYITNVNHELIMNDRILMIRELENESHDGAFVARKIREYIEEFGLTPHVERITFVTDRGSNMVSALRKERRVHCFAHLINNTVSTMLKDNEIVAAASAIVHYFKMSGQNTVFGTTLKSHVRTRWNTVFYMNASILQHYEEISSILREKAKHLDDLEKISRSKLQLMQDLFKKFKDASTELEGSSYPTLYLVKPWYEDISEHLNANDNDSVFISDLKRTGAHYWHTTVKLYLTDIHSVATFLHPMMKGLKSCTTQEKSKIYRSTTKLMDNLFGLVTSNTRQSSEIIVGMSSAAHRFLDCTSETETNEMDEYKELKVRTISSLLEWWEDHKNSFPNLYKLARFVHSIPASSASAERIFSSAGKVCASRPNLRSEMLDHVLFLKSNFDLLNEVKKKQNEKIDDGYRSDETE